MPMHYNIKSLIQGRRERRTALFAASLAVDAFAVGLTTKQREEMRENIYNAFVEDEIAQTAQMYVGKNMEIAPTLPPRARR